MSADVTISGKELVAYAREIGTGKPYVLGARGPNAFDCSGLILAVFDHFAIATFPNLPREAGAQARWLAVNGQQISIEAAMNTPGAVLAVDKGPSGSGSGGNHIGFCMTPGVSFEARSVRLGIGSWPLTAHKWTGGYLVPNIDYSFQIQEEDMPPYVIVGLAGYADKFACFGSGAVRVMPLAEFTFLTNELNVPVVYDSTDNGRINLCRLAGINESSLTVGPG